MKSDNKKIRIGEIKFTNVWPVFFHFDVSGLDHEVELITQVPTQLNQRMVEGTIDMGPISSFSYAESFENYVLFPDLSVSSYGRVNSIFLFHRKPLEEIRFGKIALPTTSATSVNLLKILMSKFIEGDPHYFYTAPSLEEMMAQADAALLIGDDAIKANWHNPGYTVTDLGELWNHFTGQWMSFAVWAIREELVQKEPQLIQHIYDAFQRSKTYGLKHPEQMILKAQNKLGGTFDHWHDYFSQLCYDFGELQRQGLQLYYQLALEQGLLDRPVSLKMWSNKLVV